MKVSTARVAFMDVAVPRVGLLWDCGLVVGFACLTALCAQISFWLGVVPITGQTFGVLLSGALLGSRRGALSQLTYLAIGATGIPYWFALGGTIGVARLVGPTGGYLIGFVAAAFIVGWLAERGWDRRVGTAIIAMLAGSIVMYVFGLAWLSRFVPEGTVLQAGLYPFIVGDLVKIVAAALAVPAGWLLLRRLKGY
ncbi:MAG: biotin transporter BioY [Chloroflexi bacterium]|nr:biotin transporter BioY [Chloroflexota bacterium]